MLEPPSATVNSVADFIMAPDAGILQFGVVLFPQWELLDVAGPLEVLNMVTRLGNDSVALHFIAKDLKPVSCGPIAPDKTSTLFAGVQSFQPTHTFADCPPLDVLFVPGGMGATSPLPSGEPADLDDVLNFIRERISQVKYLFTVCTGAGLAAQAGALDGLKATANKRRWAQQTKLGPKTHWIANARWVVDGKVWTTSGVSAGIDGMVAWVAEVFGEKAADTACHAMEYVRQKNANQDPFAEANKCEDVPPQQ